MLQNTEDNYYLNLHNNIELITGGTEVGEERQAYT